MERFSKIISFIIGVTLYLLILNYNNNVVIYSHVKYKDSMSEYTYRLGMAHLKNGVRRGDLQSMSDYKYYKKAREDEK